METGHMIGAVVLGVLILISLGLSYARVLEHRRTMKLREELLELYEHSSSQLDRLLVAEARRRGAISEEEALEMARRAAEMDDQEGLGTIQALRRRIEKHDPEERE